jgi:TM2 domain-containing membrane protein YozV
MFCVNCGKPNDDTARFCHACGTPLAAAGPQVMTSPPIADPRMRGAAPVGVAGTAPRFATGKNPTVAVILSVLIVGVGQFYNGDMKKGGIMLGGAVVAALLTVGLGWFAMAIWSAIDAYQVASGKSPLW